MEKQQIKPLLYESYIAVIENSLGSNSFKNLYALVDGVKKDVLNDGEYSCAFFVSSVLNNLELIEKAHATVKSTTKDLMESGWFEINKPRVGSVLIWEKTTFEDGSQNSHIGFYVGNDDAISNSWKEGVPVRHHWTFGTEKPKKVEKILWHKNLDSETEI